ncbi:MAG TPA: hypothetical protein VGQ17_10730 [Gemmatimonadales bacterium]|jgi:hypothetical protein|nr:hypothetical protein [Gemmatimonadales bacterium]
MPSVPDPATGIVRVGSFNRFIQRFEDLIGASTRMVLFFIHSRRWRENHDAAIKGFLERNGTSLEVFLPDLEDHELMFSLGKHFDDGPQIPGMVVDAYRYFGRLAREYRKPADLWLFARYPTFSFYRFDEHTVMAPYSNSAARKDLPAFEVTNESALGKFIARDIADLKKECRQRSPESLEEVIGSAAVTLG